MTDNRNPQASQMADESMVRCLRAQAEAIWPQESRLIAGYELPGSPAVLDVACGTGEITQRLATLLPSARVIGVDLVEPHLELGRKLCGPLGPRVRFEVGDAYHLRFDDDAFDLTLCRHLLQAIPNPMEVLAELARVTRPGGRLHLVAEDYAMMYFHPVEWDTDAFWRDGPVEFAGKTGTDLRSGRKMFTYLTDLGLSDIRVEFVAVDTLRVPRETFAAIWMAWRDGYTDAIAAHSTLSREEILEYWRQMLACINNPKGYSLWMLPVVTAIVP